MKEKTLALTAGAIGLLAAAVPIFQRLVLLPIYVEHSNYLFASFNRLNSMLVLPGKILVYRVWPPPEHYFLTWQLIAASGFNFLIYAFIALLLLSGYRRYRRRRASKPLEQDTSTANNPQSLDRRTFLVTAATGAAGLGAIAAGVYPILIEPDWLKVRRLTIRIKDLPPSLAGLKIVQMTDIHHDEWISLRHIADAVKLANSLRPDIVALTGDYVTASRALVAPSINALSALTPALGTVAVLGNHDWWTDPKETRRQFARVNIPLVDNSRQFFSADRQLVADIPASGLCIGGVGDLWEDAIEPETAFRDVPSDMPRLLLSHNPDVAEQGSIAAGQLRIDLMLSGHTHGGQVRLPGLGTPIVPSAYGSKYAYGLVQGPSCRVNVSSGVGLAMLPVRLNVRPEIVEITLTPA